MDMGIRCAALVSAHRRAAAGMCGIQRLVQGISGHYEATDPHEAGSSDMSGTGYPWPVGQLEKEGVWREG